MVEGVWPERGAATKGDAAVWRWSPVGEEVARVKAHLAVTRHLREQFGCEGLRGDHEAPHGDGAATKGGEEAICVSIHTAEDVLRSDAAARCAYFVPARDLEDSAGRSLLANLNAGRLCGSRHRGVQSRRLNAATFIHGESASKRLAVGELLDGASVQEPHGEAERLTQIRFRAEASKAAHRVRQLHMSSSAPLGIDPRSRHEGAVSLARKRLDTAHSGA